MRLLTVVATLGLAVAAPAAGAPSLAAMGTGAGVRVEAVDAAPPRGSPTSAAARTMGPAPPTSTADPAAGRPPDPAGAGGPDPASSALLPKVLAVVLGLVAASLAARRLAAQTRRPPARHLR